MNDDPTRSQTTGPGGGPACCRAGPASAAGSGGVVYGLGVIGAAVYYIQAANGFWMAALGLLKALVWPAFLVYELLELAGAA